MGGPEVGAGAPEQVFLPPFLTETRPETRPGKATWGTLVGEETPTFPLLSLIPESSPRIG